MFHVVRLGDDPSGAGSLHDRGAAAHRQRIVLRSDPPVGRGTPAVALAVSAIALFTGWIGGEVLVFHSGMARDEDFGRIETDARRMQEVCKVMADEGVKDARNASILASMSQTLGGDASDIEQAAHNKSLQEIAKAVGETSGHCADCHEQVRWKPRAR